MFDRKCAVIAMLHLDALPGSDDYRGSVRDVLVKTLEEAQLYKKCGVDALLIENMHDVPFLKGYVEPETTAAAAVIAAAVKDTVSLPVGIQLLAAANKEALGAAIGAGLDFIRVEGFVFGHVGDEGYHDSCAAQLVRRRSFLKANHIKIFADIKKKHSAHAITSDISLGETAKACEFFKADGVIVTGGFTGDAPRSEDVKEARKAVSKAVLVGSGVTTANLGDYHGTADAVIVGSNFKHNGEWAGSIDEDRVRAFMSAHNKLEC